MQQNAINIDGHTQKISLRAVITAYGRYNNNKLAIIPRYPEQPGEGGHLRNHC